jgi:hypothetical protein
LAELILFSFPPEEGSSLASEWTAIDILKLFEEMH